MLLCDTWVLFPETDDANSTVEGAELGTPLKQKCFVQTNGVKACLAKSITLKTFQGLLQKIGAR